MRRAAVFEEPEVLWRQTILSGPERQKPRQDKGERHCSFLGDLQSRVPIPDLISDLLGSRREIPKITTSCSCEFLDNHMAPLSKASVLLTFLDHR
jgi:hypothetical protein